MTNNTPTTPRRKTAATNLSVSGTIKSKDDAAPIYPIAFGLTLKLEEIAPLTPHADPIHPLHTQSAPITRMSEPVSSGLDGPDLPQPSPQTEPQVFDVHAVELQTDTNGIFQYEYDVPSLVRDKLTRKVKCTVELQAHVPHAHLRTEEVTASGDSSDEVLAAFSGKLADIAYKIPFKGLRAYGLWIFVGSDAATQSHFNNVSQLNIALHYNASNPLPMPPPAAPLRLPAPEQYVYPCARPQGGSTFHGSVYLEFDQTTRGEYHIEATGEGVNVGTRCVLRSPPMSGDDLRTNSYGFIQKLVTDVSAGSITQSISDRYAKSPFVLKDLDIDLYKDEIRVRGTAAIGLGINMVLFSVGKFDIRLKLTLISFHNLAFTEAEYGNLFGVEVTSTSLDALPGTDIDELPAWVWAAIFPFAPTLTGWAALVAAFETIAEPIVRDITRAQVASLLANEVVRAKNDAQDDFLAQASSLSADEQAALTKKLWYETDTVKITSEHVEVIGFVGIWGSGEDVTAFS
jgi:hypothetical protein